MGDLGFSIVEDVLSRQECQALANALESLGARRRRAGARNLMSKPAISAIAYDSRLLHLAANTLSAPAVPFRATLFDKSRTSNWHVLWHQDRSLPLSRRLHSAEWGPWSTKSGVLYALAPAWALERVVALRIHIDPSTNDNGALRVIPASHKAGVLSSAEILRATSAVPPRTCVVERGGVLAMRPLLLHSSMKASDNQLRRVLHIEYANGLDLGNDIRLCVA
ncbi:MAG TPA: phytanoyl-CoA dioxygenase family protein [Pyrinomonadaceae bacterium]|nr:phytanoyl-CoA dioxygenase family protein [Pyrinomonadaceae bacterium]